MQRPPRVSSLAFSVQFGCGGDELIALRNRYQDIDMKTSVIVACNLVGMIPRAPLQQWHLSGAALETQWLSKIEDCMDLTYHSPFGLDEG